MNENEVMNNEVETEVMSTENNDGFSGVACGAAGALITLGLVYGGYMLRKLWIKHKVNKIIEEQDVVETEDSEDVNNEEEHKETQK